MMGLVKIVYGVLVTAALLSLGGCGGEVVQDINDLNNLSTTPTTTPTTPTPTPVVPTAPTTTNTTTGGIGILVNIGPFTASYYNGTALVASELAARPSINYTAANFKGIDSTNFNAVWVGNVTISGTDQTIDINFDVNWSDVTLIIDGVEIAVWANTSQTITHLFTVGVHEVKIVYANHWTSTNFNVSFTTNMAYTMATAPAAVQPLIDATTQIIYAGAYESGELYNNITVNLSTTGPKVFLFLSSARSANWIIKNPNNVLITGIAYSSPTKVSTVTSDTTVAQFEVDGFSYGYPPDFTLPIADITTLALRAPDFTCGAYSLTQINLVC